MDKLLFLLLYHPSRTKNLVKYLNFSSHEHSVNDTFRYKTIPKLSSNTFGELVI